MNRFIAAVFITAATLVGAATSASAHNPPKGDDHVVVAGRTFCDEGHATITWTAHNPTRLTVMVVEAWATSPTASTFAATIGSQSDASTTVHVPDGSVETATITGHWIESDRVDTQSATVTAATCTPATTTTTVEATTTTVRRSHGPVPATTTTTPLAFTGAADGPLGVGAALCIVLGAFGAWFGRRRLHPAR